MSGEPTRTRRRTRIKWWLLGNAHFIFPFAATVLTLVSTYILIGPVLNRSGDNIYHLMNEFAIAHNIAVGDDPFGPLGIEFGQPVLRFYQALFYLFNVAMYFVTGADLLLLHNLPIIVCFSLSPWAYYYFLRKLGLNQWASGIGSFCSMASVAAFGNSFEAYHQAGIVTQSMGGLFFPWFMGHFIGMLRGENRVSSTALLFALAFLSHAIMSVFAAFAGVLYFIISPIPMRVVWKRLLGFTVLGVCLVAFWVFPFIAHTKEMRPVPDSIIRGAGVHWFTSVSKSELAMVLGTGRLLDDPPIRKKADWQGPRDKLMDRISIIGTLRTRPPAVTALTGLGVLVALFGFKRRSRRFLLGGFFFSLMLFAGPDDFPWLKYLPFMENIQTFRCTYLVEFFAFGLVGLGTERLLRYLGRFVRTRKPFVRRPLTVLWGIFAFILCGFFGSEIVLLGQKHMAIREQTQYDAMIDAMANVDNRAFPYRVSPQHYPGRFKIRHAWLSHYGYLPYCTHWKGTGPTSALNLCRSLGTMHRNPDLNALVAARYHTGTKAKIENLSGTKDKDGDLYYHRIANGKDRRNKPNSWHYFLDTGRDHYLNPMAGAPLPVVANHSQWVWLVKSWTSKFQRKLASEITPITMRAKAGKLNLDDYQGEAKAILYLEHKKVKEDLLALKKFAESGGIILSPKEIDGVEVSLIDHTKKIWDQLPEDMKQPPKSKDKKYARYELGPGFRNVWITRHKDPKRSVQNFTFDIDALETKVMILPMEAAPGWKAALDGKPLAAFPSGPDLVGVVLPRGAHQLDFYWEMPLWHKATIWASLLGVLFVLLIGLFVTIQTFRSVRREQATLIRIGRGA